MIEDDRVHSLCIGKDMNLIRSHEDVRGTERLERRITFDFA